MDSVGMDTVGMVCLSKPAACPSDESETDTLAILVESVRVHQLLAVCVPARGACRESTVTELPSIVGRHLVAAACA